QARCARHHSLRRRDPDRGPHGPRRRSHLGARRQAFAQTPDHVRHVRRGGRIHQTDGGPVNFTFGLMIESLVAVLLLITIGYCVVLNRRLKRLKGDEQALKATISELITATEIAGRAVAGLKATAQDCDGTLGGACAPPSALPPAWSASSRPANSC